MKTVKRIKWLGIPMAIALVIALTLNILSPQVGIDGGGFLSVSLGKYVLAADDWISPTSHDDPDSAWTDEQKAYDEITASNYALETSVTATVWGNYLVLYPPYSILGDRFRIMSNHPGPGTYEEEIDFYYEGDWHNIYSGAFADSSWETKINGAGAKTITAARIRYLSSVNKSNAAWIREFDFYGSEAELADISNTPAGYDFGTVFEGTTSSTGFMYFVTTNNGDSLVDIAISGTDMTGGTTWTLSDTATPDTNVVGFKAGISGSHKTAGQDSTSYVTVGLTSGAENSLAGPFGLDAYSFIIKKTPTYNNLVENLAAGAELYWGLQMLMPTGFTDSAEKTGTITITATEVP